MKSQHFLFHLLFFTLFYLSQSFSKKKFLKHEYNTLNDIENDMTIHKLEKFQNILNENKKIQQINQTLLNLGNYLEIQKVNFENYKNKIIQQNQLIIDQFDKNDKDKEINHLISEDNLKDVQEMNNQFKQIKNNIQNLTSNFNINNETGIFKKELLNMMIENELSELKNDEFELNKNKNNQNFNIQKIGLVALKKKVINITNYLDSLIENLNNLNKGEKLQYKINNNLQQKEQKNDDEQIKVSYNKLVNEITNEIYNQFNISLQIKNLTKIDYLEVEEEIKPIFIKLDNIFEDVKYQAKTLLSRYEMLISEKQFLIKYLQKQLKNINSLSQQQSNLIKIFKNIQNTRKKTLNDINNFMKSNIINDIKKSPIINQLIKNEVNIINNINKPPINQQQKKSEDSLLTGDYLFQKNIFL